MAGADFGPLRAAIPAVGRLLFAEMRYHRRLIISPVVRVDPDSVFRNPRGLPGLRSRETRLRPHDPTSQQIASANPGYCASQIIPRFTHPIQTVAEPYAATAGQEQEEGLHPGAGLVSRWAGRAERCRDGLGNRWPTKAHVLKRSHRLVDGKVVGGPPIDTSQAQIRLVRTKA